MRPESWFKRLLRKLGIIKEPKFDEQESNKLKGVIIYHTFNIIKNGSDIN